ncbi:MAG: gamma-glutamyl-gamma-aminobutyrate hydrolase family protein [Clostridiales bacterium]|nr:gamma-glutamyl-gamma-aminobutyrate hydrolase family protein [Clostridiales bacterium]
MNHPLILLTPQYNDDNTKMTSPKRYTDRLTEHGAIPVITPNLTDESAISDLVAVCDGVLFTGGDDVDPEIYGREKEPDCGFITRYRDDFEILLTKEAMRQKKPILGICRGIQILNVALGGTLVQHRPGHRSVVHGVDIVRDSLLYGILGAEKIKTNSFHHQLIDDPCPGGRITAYAEDGTPEALEIDYKPFFLGVQWHPEYLSGEECDGWSSTLIGAFVEECTKNMRR